MSASTRRTASVLAMVVACVVLGAPAPAFATISLTPQGVKLTGTGEMPPSDFGWSVALSADGNTALVGGYTDNNDQGAAWVFNRSGGVWTQQAELLPNNEINHPADGNGEFGYSVALSADGNTALIGGPGDDTTSGMGGVGAAWVFTRSGTTWSQQTKLLGSGENGDALFGQSVALSSNGNTALVGGSEDGGVKTEEGDGAAWQFIRTGTSWDSGTKLIGDCLSSCTGANGSGEVSSGHFGESVAISADGSTGLIGAGADGGDSGAAWFFSLGTTPAEITELKEGTCTTTEGCTQVTGESGPTSSFGSSVALSNDGTTALIGGQSDSSSAGAAWVFTSTSSTGPWGQQAELTGTGESGAGFFGQSAGLSSDGSTALIGGSQDQGAGTTSSDGAAWAFTRSGTAWTQQGGKLVGDCSTNCAANGTGESGAGEFGNGVAVSGDGSTVLVGGPTDSSSAGAAWPFTISVPTATTTALAASPNPSQIGQLVTFTATVSPAPDGGTVSFTDNGASLCSNVALSAGVATCRTSFAAATSYAVVASYAGDTAYTGSTSNTVTQVVSGGQTTTTLSSSENPAPAYQPVSYTATVSPVPDGGTVRFTGGSGAISGCEAVPVSAGTATCHTTYTAVGDYRIIAIYNGDASYGASDTNSLIETITYTNATVVLSSSENPAPGGMFVLTATVSPVLPGGQVDFYDVTTSDSSPPICSQVTISAAGQATCAVTLRSLGAHQMVAGFLGGGAVNGAFSQTLTETVTLGPYSNSSIAISMAQQAGDPAQTGPSGSSLAYDGVPLVTGRATVARVFADPVGTGVPGTVGLRATLYGSVNGHALPGSPLSDDAGGPKALVEAEFDAQLGEADTSFNFPLPRSWTTGDVQLRAVVAPEPAPNPATTAACSGPCTASLTLRTVHFHNVPTFEVTPVELTWTNNKTGALEAPGNPQAAMATAYHLMPVQKIVNESYQGTIDETALQSDPGGLGGNQADADGLNLVVQWATTQFLNSTYPSSGNLHDMVVGFNVDIARGDTEYDSSLGVVHNAKGVVTDNVSEPVAVVDAPYGFGVAHEMGHAVGRRHADESCKGPASGGSDPNWPDYNGVLEPTTGFANGHTGTWSAITSAPVASYGINPSWRVASASGPGPLRIFPDTDYDYMSYCAGNNLYTTPTEASPGVVWISARGWQQEYRCMSNETNPPTGCPVNEQQPSAGRTPVSGGAADIASASSGPAVNGPVISFRGYLEPGGSLISPALMSSVGGVTGPASSAFTATVVSRRGKVIATEPLGSQSIHFDPYPGHPAVPLLALQGAIPTHGQPVAGLIVRAAGQVRAKITAPRQAPRVTVAIPRVNRRTRSLTVRWNSHDRSTARRTAFVAVSTTGRRYATVWEGFDQDRASIPLAELPRAGRIRLRVFVTDGFRSSVATTRPIRLKARVRTARAAKPPAWLTGLERDGIDVVAP